MNVQQQNMSVIQEQTELLFIDITHHPGKAVLNRMYHSLRSNAKKKHTLS